MSTKLINGSFGKMVDVNFGWSSVTGATVSGIYASLLLFDHEDRAVGVPVSIDSPLEPEDGARFVDNHSEGETFRIEFRNLPTTVCKVMLCIAVRTDEQERPSQRVLDQISGLSVRVVDTLTQVEIVRRNFVCYLMDVEIVVIAELFRIDDSDWYFDGIDKAYGSVHKLIEELLSTTVKRGWSRATRDL